MKRGSLQEILNKLSDQGWSITLKNGHYRLLSPKGGMPIFTGSTPGDKRAVLNLRSTLRRNGADL